MTKQRNLVLIILFLIIPLDLMAIPGEPIDDEENIIDCGSQKPITQRIVASGTGPDAQKECWAKFNALRDDPQNYMKCRQNGCNDGICKPKFVVGLGPYYHWTDGPFTQRAGKKSWFVSERSSVIKNEDGVYHLVIECGYWIKATLKCECTPLEQR